MTNARTSKTPASKASAQAKSRKAAPAEAERFDVYQHVTDKIVAALEAGTRPWEQPWRSTGCSLRPLRFNGEPYRGVNVLMLWWIPFRLFCKSPGLRR